LRLRLGDLDGVCHLFDDDGLHEVILPAASASNKDEPPAPLSRILTCAYEAESEPRVVTPSSTSPKEGRLG
jgi:hypothetical protein